MKFLIPFSLLVAIGHQLEWPTRGPAAPTAIVFAVEDLSQPFAYASSTPAGAPLPVIDNQGFGGSPIVVLLVFGWLLGAFLVSLRWFREWRRVRGSLKTASRLELNVPIGALATESPVEPGIVGIFRPVLLLPKGLMDRLTPAQIDAVLAHEFCHVRRRDNLAAAMHMMVEALFWFHPLVWWIERRLVDERERACDEEVLRRGGEPQVYAEGILNVCRFYRESPLACVSGVSGSNLKKRIEEIMRNRVALNLSFSRAALLAVAFIIALTGPIVVGAVKAAAGRAEAVLATSPAATSAEAGEERSKAQPPEQAPAAAPAFQAVRNSSEPRETFEVASVRPTRYSAGGERGTGNPGNASIRPPIDPCGDHPNSFFLKFDPSRAMVSDMPVHGLIAWAWSLPCPVLRGNPFILGGPGWTRSDGYDIEALIPAGPPAYTAAEQNIPGAPKERQTMTPRFRKMLQALLEDRFKLVLRHEMRDMPVYALTIAKSGLKLTPWKEGDPATFAELWAKLGLPATEREIARQAQEAGQQDRSNPTGLRAPMSVLVSQIKNAADRPVIDRTGITEGVFNYRLTFSRLLPPYPSDLLPPRGEWSVTAPSLFTALEEQLGLKLEAVTAPMDVWVIERVERPSEN
jgi:uncharacterized protein (TIGR03435 family)